MIKTGFNRYRIFQIICFAFPVFIPALADAVILKIATLSPEGSGWMQKMRLGAKDVARRTDNRVRFKFYPGGVMGDDKTVLRKIRIGQLQGGAVVAGSLSKYFRDNQVYSLPLNFRSFEEVDYVRSKMDTTIIDGLKKGGFVTFGLAEGGFAYIMSNKPVLTIDDLRRQKMWVPDNDETTMEIVKSFGITPIPLSIADVRTGLQTGLIDTVATPPIGAIALQWHTQIKYLLDVPLVYIFAVMAVDRKVFEKISPANQMIVREVMERVFKDIDRENRKDNVKALQVLRKQGVQFMKPSSEELKQWYASASKILKQMVIAGRLSEGIVQILEKNINDYRSGRFNADE